MSNAKLKELDQQLKTIQQQQRQEVRLENRLKRIKREITSKRLRLKRLQRRVSREEEDVVELQRRSFKAFIHVVQNTLKEQLTTEKAELLRAEMRYFECRAEIETLEDQKESIATELLRFSDLDLQYQQTILEKQQLLGKLSHHQVDRIRKKQQQMVEPEARLWEYQQAIEAGKVVEAQLKEMEHEFAIMFRFLELGGKKDVDVAYKHLSVLHQQLVQFDKELVDIDPQLALPAHDMIRLRDVQATWHDSWTHMGFSPTVVHAALRIFESVRASVKRVMHELTKRHKAIAFQCEMLQTQYEKLVEAAR